MDEAQGIVEPDSKVLVACVERAQLKAMVEIASRVSLQQAIDLESLQRAEIRRTVAVHLPCLAGCQAKALRTDSHRNR